MASIEFSQVVDDEPRCSPRDHLSVVIVAYQEEEALGPLIEELFAALDQVQSLEVIIVNDGSQDGTAQVMQGLSFPTNRLGRLKLIHLPNNQGMGAALKKGYQQATEPWVTFLPGDGQLAPASLEALFKEADQGYELITTRYQNRHYSAFRWLLSYGLRILSTLIIGTRVQSEGMYLIRRELLQQMPLHSDSFMLNLEIPIRAVRAKYKIGLAWIDVRARQGGVSSATRFGRIFSTLIDLILLRYQLEKERLNRLRHAWGISESFALLKILIIGGGIVWASITGLLAQTAAQLTSLALFTVLNAWLLMALGISLGAVRWLCLLKATQLYRPSLSQAIRLCYEGLFFNVFVPGSVGGDLLRAHWLKRRDQHNSNLHFVITMGERLLGMLSLGLLMVLGVSSIPMAGLIIISTLVFVIFSPKLLQRLIKYLPKQKQEQGRLRSAFIQICTLLKPLANAQSTWILTALLINMIGHLTSFALFIIVAQDLGIHLAWSAWLVSLSVSLFFANLPLSIAGVGPRELSMVTTLGVYGISEELALALSLSSLAILIIQALFGGILHLIWPSQEPKT